jgi:hypothetical protein
MTDTEELPNAFSERMKALDLLRREMPELVKAGIVILTKEERTAYEDAERAFSRTVVDLTIKLEKAGDQVAALKYKLHHWTAPRTGTDAFGIGYTFPVPRVQMTLVPDDHRGRRGFRWDIGIVLPDYTHEGELEFFPLSSVTTGHFSAERDALVPGEPHRGGLYFRKWSVELGLPGYVFDFIRKRWGLVGEPYKEPAFLQTGDLNPSIIPEWCRQ